MVDKIYLITDWWGLGIGDWTQLKSNIGFAPKTFVVFEDMRLEALRVSPWPMCSDEGQVLCEEWCEGCALMEALLF